MKKPLAWGWLVILGTALIFPTSAAQALSCASLNFQQAFADADLVIEATPLGLMSTKTTAYHWVVTVKSVYKGTAPWHLEIEDRVWPGTNQHPGRLHLGGGSYLLFLHQIESTYVLGICDNASRSLTAQSLIPEEAAILGTAQGPAYTAIPINSSFPAQLGGTSPIVSPVGTREGALPWWQRVVAWITSWF